MKITYAITVCNESFEIQKLITFLLALKDKEDDINVLVDTKNVTSQVTHTLESFKDDIELNYRDFNKDFGRHRNYHFTTCKGDYIFIIDADELPREFLIKKLKGIIESSKSDCIWLPRINLIPDMTEEQNELHRFSINDNGWINWPDYTGRIIKNNGQIKYKMGNNLHETLNGARNTVKINPSPQLALWHIKYIERQNEQRRLYDTISDVDSL